MSEDVNRVARAIQHEDQDGHRWVIRDNRWSGKGFEVCRFDDSGIAGEFSEVHSYPTHEKAEAGLKRRRYRALAKAAISAALAGR